MTREEIGAALRSLGEKLAARGVRGEVLVAGGAALVLSLGVRDVTQDVDAYLGDEPQQVREAAEEVARERGLPAGWLNDAVKGFFNNAYTGTPPHALWAEYGGLAVYVVDPRYLFAMKAIAGRPRDVDDLVALAEHLGLHDVSAGLDLVCQYVPERLLTPRVRYTVEAAFARRGAPAPSGPDAWPHGFVRSATGTLHLRKRAVGTETLCGRDLGSAAIVAAPGSAPRWCLTCRRMARRSKREA